MGFEAAMMTQGNPIPTSWSLVKVGEVADINKSTISVNNAPKWIEYIDISSVGERKIDPPIPMEFNAAPSRARRRVFPEDILISTVRPNLKHFFYLKKAKYNWVASTGFAVVSAKPKIDSCYLYYYLTSEIFTEYLTRVADGGAYPAFNPSEIKNAELLLPPLAEQKAIAHILGTLDDKIELNQQMNRNLEAIASAIFKSWFVDFDPVRAKIEGRQPVGMDAATAALFPDSFEDSPLGEIPKGWSVANIYELVDVVYGAPFSSKLFNNEGLGKPLIRIRDLATYQPEVYTTEIHSKQTEIEPGDIVVGMDGEFRVHHWLGAVSLLNQRVCNFRPKPGVPKSFVSQVICKPLEFYERSKTGTTVIHLGKTDIDTFQVINPTREVLVAYGAVVEPLIDRVIANASECSTLATIRDTLLPKLMSGEIQVKEAEKIVEAVA